jgi:hypothetical protein
VSWRTCARAGVCRRAASSACLQQLQARCVARVLLWGGGCCRRCGVWGRLAPAAAGRPSLHIRMGAPAAGVFHSCAEPHQQLARCVAASERETMGAGLCCQVFGRGPHQLLRQARAMCVQAVRCCSESQQHHQAAHAMARAMHQRCPAHTRACVSLPPPCALCAARVGRGVCGLCVFTAPSPKRVTSGEGVVVLLMLQPSRERAAAQAAPAGIRGGVVVSCAGPVCLRCGATCCVTQRNSLAPPEVLHKALGAERPPSLGQ